MGEIFQQISEQVNNNRLVSLVIAAVLGAFLTEFIPFLWNASRSFRLWLGKKVGGPLQRRSFEKQYLDWVVTKYRELNLAGIVSSPDLAKKPQLEDVFVSLRMSEKRQISFVDELEALEPESRQALSHLTTYLSSPTFLLELRQRRYEYEVILRHGRSRLQTVLQRLPIVSRRSTDAREKLNKEAYFRARKQIKRGLIERFESEAVDRELVEEIVERSLRQLVDPDWTNELQGIMQSNQRIAILGPPGAGKTTLLLA